MPDIYVNGRVRVRREQCEHCLFSANRLVDGERARDLVKWTRLRDGASFVCHREQVSTEPAAVCRTWFDRYAQEDWVFRLAIAMEIIEEVG